jgi:hypothetical protein
MNGLGVFEVNLARNSSSESLGHSKGRIYRCSQCDVSAIWRGTITHPVQEQRRGIWLPVLAIIITYGLAVSPLQGVFG